VVGLAVPGPELQLRHGFQGYGAFQLLYARAHDQLPQPERGLYNQGAVELVENSSVESVDQESHQMLSCYL
jgi:hypothetical protein